MGHLSFPTRQRGRGACCERAAMRCAAVLLSAAATGWAPLPAASATAAVAGAGARLTSDALSDRAVDELWDFFRRRHNKTYASAAEEARRRAVFAESIARAAALNDRSPRAHYGASPLADRTRAEMRARMGRRPPPAREVRAARGAVRTNHTLRDPTARFSPAFHAKVRREFADVDWRTKGAVTTPMDQGQCGSCWTFAATGAIEGAWGAAGNGAPFLSQQLFGSCCALPGCDGGCAGGDVGTALQWLVQSRGGNAATLDAYPYESADGNNHPCRDSSSLTNGAQINSLAFQGQSEADMAAWVAAKGPISVSIDGSVLQTYVGGTITTCSPHETDHAVVIVGYSDSFWIVKNSWGTSWGEGGFFKVQRGNNCLAIASHPVAAVVGSPQLREYTQHVFTSTDCSGSGQTSVWLVDVCEPKYCGQGCGLDGYDGSRMATLDGSSLSIGEYADFRCQTSHGSAQVVTPDYCYAMTGGGSIMWTVSTTQPGAKPAGTPPTPVPPGGPPTPEPAEMGWTQLSCSDQGCTACARVTFAYGRCFQYSDGSSGRVRECSGGTIRFEYFWDAECAVANDHSDHPTGQCLAGASGGYIQFVCSGTPPPPPAPTPAPVVVKQWSQHSCTDSTCASCSVQSFSVSSCLQYGSGGSLKVVGCNDWGITFEDYSDAACTTQVNSQTVEVGMCLEYGDGTAGGYTCG